MYDLSTAVLYATRKAVGDRDLPNFASNVRFSGATVRRLELSLHSRLYLYILQSSTAVHCFIYFIKDKV